MQRFIIYLLLIGLIYFFVRKALKSFFAPSDQQPSETGKPPADADMIQDPQCGAYFLKNRGIKGVVEGKVVHFCSEECYDKYVKQRLRS